MNWKSARSIAYFEPIDPSAFPRNGRGAILTTSLRHRPFFRQHEARFLSRQGERVANLTATQTDAVNLISVFLRESHTHPQWQASNRYAVKWTTGLSA